MDSPKQKDVISEDAFENENQKGGNFEILNNKLDRLMQIVAMTEKKPSTQMKHLLKLNDNDEDLRLYSKQANLELQNIVNEQNKQLNTLRKSYLEKQDQREQEIIETRETLYREIKQQAEMIQYLVGENKKLRKSNVELSNENQQFSNLLKEYSSQAISQPKLNKESNNDNIEEGEESNKNQIIIIEDISSNSNEDCKSKEKLPDNQEDLIRLKRQVTALEKMVFLILKSESKGTDQRVEIINLKNQLEDSILEVNLHKKQIIELKKNLSNSKSAKPKQGAKQTVKQATNGRRTRGNRVNYAKLMQEEEDIEDDDQEEEGSDGQLEGQKNGLGSEEDNEEISGHSISEEMNVQTKRNPQKNKKQEEETKKRNKGEENSDSSFDSEEERSEKEDEEENESDFSEPEKKNNKKQIAKNGRNIPPKKKPVTTTAPKKKQSKKILKKNQEAQNRIFDQVDRMLNDL